MDKKISRYKIDFNFLKDDTNILAILLFGSQVEKKITMRSDTDICIVAPNIREVNERVSLLKKININVDVFGKRYDVWQFEELPLYIKMEIINNHEVIYCRDLPELYEYFYFLRKLWKDQKHRQELSKEELIIFIE